MLSRFRARAPLPSIFPFAVPGSRGRLVGVLVLDLGLVAALCGALYGSFSFAGGLPGLKALIGV